MHFMNYDYEQAEPLRRNHHREVVGRIQTQMIQDGIHALVAFRGDNINSINAHPSVFLDWHIQGVTMLVIPREGHAIGIATEHEYEAISRNGLEPIGECAATGPAGSRATRVKRSCGLPAKRSWQARFHTAGHRGPKRRSRGVGGSARKGGAGTDGCEGWASQSCPSGIAECTTGQLPTDNTKGQSI